MWHRKLGHLNYRKMLEMKAAGDISFQNNEVAVMNCIVCAEGKPTRKEFSSSSSQTTEVLELVHSDLMGPMETMSNGGSRYVLLFIDDFSRKVFVCTIKSKSEVLSAFVENQTDKKIKKCEPTMAPSMLTQISIVFVRRTLFNIKRLLHILLNKMV